MDHIKHKASSHPHQKGNQLLKSIINHSSSVNDTILDVFMGTGTVLTAAKLLRRKAIGIEMEEKYCEIAANRLQQEVFAFS